MEICGRGLCQDAADQRAFANALEALRLEILFESNQSLRFIFSQIRSCYPLCILRDSTMNRLARLLFNELIPMMKIQRVIMGRSGNQMYGATFSSSLADDEALEFNTPAGCDVWQRRWRSCGRIWMPWTRAWRTLASRTSFWSNLGVWRTARRRTSRNRESSPERYYSLHPRNAKRCGGGSQGGAIGATIPRSGRGHSEAVSRYCSCNTVILC